MSNWNVLGATKQTTLAASTITRSVTKGSLLVLMWWTGQISGSPTGFQPSDDMGNVWIADPRTRLVGSFSCAQEMYYAIAKSTGSMTVTIADPGAFDSGSIIEIDRGFDPVGPFHKSATVVDGSRSTATDGEASGSVTTERDGCLILSCMFCTNTQPAVQFWTPGTGYTDIADASNDPGGASGITWHWEYKVQDAAGAINPTWTASNNTDPFDGWTIALAPTVAPAARPRVDPRAVLTRNYGGLRARATPGAKGWW